MLTQNRAWMRVAGRAGVAAVVLAMCGPVMGQGAGGVGARAEAAAGKESVITSSGTARVTRTPDYVDISIGAVREDRSALVAQTGAMKAMQDATNAIKDMKLDGAELQSGAVELAPKYENHRDDTEPKIVGYTATMTLRVRTKDLQSPAKVIDAALKAGCNRVEGVQFGLTAAIEAREEAVRLATKAAKRKATVMAEALDLRIERVIDASTNSGYWGGWYGGNRYANVQMAQVAGGGGGGGGSPEDQSPVAPGKIEIWAEANVSFGAGAPK